MRVSRSLIFLSAMFAGLQMIAENASDSEIKAVVADSCEYRHREVADDAIAYAFRLANSDSNRFTRLMKELARENLNSAGIAVVLVGQYGGTNDLEFLYSIAAGTNNQLKARTAALEFIVENAIVSSNMLSVVCDYVFDCNVPDWARQHKFVKMLSHRHEELERLGLELQWKHRLLDYVGLNEIRYFMAEDMIRRDYPEYMRSRERRDLVNRVAASHAVEGNVYAMTALTNALEELSRIPENEFVDFIPSGAN